MAKKEDREFQAVLDAIRQRLAERLEDRSMTQEALVDASGVTKGYLSQLLRGDAANPGLKYIWKLARALDLPLSDLLGEDQDAAAEPSELKEFPRMLRDYARDYKRKTGKDIPLDIVEKMYKTPGRRLGDRDKLAKEQWKVIHELVVMANTGGDQLEKLGVIVDFAKRLES